MSVLYAARLKLSSGAAPLLVICGTILWYSLAGCFDLLIPAGVLWCASALSAAVILVLRRREICWREIFEPGFVFFLIAALVAILYLAVRQPIFMDWDEFSFWGIAAKVVKSTNRLYTLEPGSMVGVTYVPGLIMLDYAFQFLGLSFVPWKVFAAYDILMFAVFAAGISFCRRRQWHIAVPLAVTMVLLPYLLTLYYRDVYVRPIYMSSYADIPMGILFGAGIAAYFAAEKKTPAVLLCTLFAVTAESISKDMGFALCLIAAALVCFDLLFLERGEVRLAALRGVPAKLGWCALMVGLPTAAFFGWAAHLSSALSVSRFDLGGSGQMGMAEMVITGIAELFGFGRSEKFAQVMADMLSAFYTSSITMFSSGLVVVVVILTLLAGAWLCGNDSQRCKVAWFSILSSLGFVAFYVFNIFTYVYIFKEAEASTLSNYNRYIYPYYIGWMLAALVLLGKCAAGYTGALRRRAAIWQGALMLVPYLLLAAFLAISGSGGRTQWIVLLAGAAAMAAVLVIGGIYPRARCLVSLGITAFAVVCCLRVTSLVQPQLSVVDYPDSYFAGRKEDIKKAQEVADQLEEGTRLFYVCTGDDGGNWFKRYYDFYPDVILDYSLGGTGFDESARFNSVSIPRFFTQEQAEYFIDDEKELTPEFLCEYLEASGCTAIWLEEVDDGFRALYGELFTDGISGKYSLYRIEGTAQEMRFVPVEEVAAE